MTRKRETVVLLEELAAIETNVRQMSEQASRSAERYERRVQTGSEVNATDELAERALIDELKAHGDNSRKATLKFTACYGRLLEEGEVTAAEFEAMEEAKWSVCLNMLTVTATCMTALRPEVRRRLDAITARAGEVGRPATVKAATEFITAEIGPEEQAE